MSMHNVSAINSMRGIENPYPVVRSAIISWYYATYYASKAMIAATSGADPQTHAAAGRIWQAEVVAQNLVKGPFALNLVDLTPSNVEVTVARIRNGNTHDLNIAPDDREMAFGAACSYLKGTAEYERWRIEEMVKESPEYRRGGYTNFRTNAAKALRDARLRPAHVNYLVQAFRFRGKANYRDAIYLSYGRDQAADVRQFISDLGGVSQAFSLMAAHFVSKRVVREDWASFSADVNNHARFELPYDPQEI
jgi:hypothetical protein